MLNLHYSPAQALCANRVSGIRTHIKDMSENRRSR